MHHLFEEEIMAADMGDDKVNEYVDVIHALDDIINHPYDKSKSEENHQIFARALRLALQKLRGIEGSLGR